MATFNPSRLQLARRRRGLTKTDLAGTAGISARSLTAYESGATDPDPSTIDRLATALRFSAEFFSGPDLEEPDVDSSSFRALTSLTARQRDQTFGAGAVAMMIGDWIEQRFKLPLVSVPQYLGVDPEMAAIGVREAWGLGERPIKNMIHLLEAHGVRVFSLVEECLDMDAFSLWRGNVPYVFLNTRKSAEHSRMDAAHELGHLVLHWKGGARGRDLEQEANLFGAAFLMPAGSVRREAPRGGTFSSIVKAKRRWGVAAANLTYRMHKLGLLTDWQYRSLFIELGRRGYRKGEPGGMSPETSQVLAKVFDALREDGISRRAVAAELGITPDDLNQAVFGLARVPADGQTGGESPPPEPPPLRLVH